MTKEISLREEQEKAKQSPLQKGMIVRPFHMNGFWEGLAGVEFYVLSDKAEPVWGHPMAIRHLFDVDPETAKILTVAQDKNGVPLFYYTCLPANCVEILEQDTWTDTNNESFLAAYHWKNEWAELAEEHAKYHAKYSKTNPRLAKLFDPEQWNWERTWARRLPLFAPNLLDKWVLREEEK